MNKIKSEESLHSFLIDDALSMDEQALDAEFRAFSLDMAEEVAKFKQVSEQASLALRKKKLSNARKHLDEKKTKQHSGAELIASMKEKGQDIKSRLASMMAKGLIPGDFTLAFRDGKDITDEEAEGILEDLIELGVVTDDD